jgi:hypothetical protein
VKRIGFNLKKALKMIGIEGKEAVKIIYNEEKSYFATELLFRSFSHFSMVLILLDKDSENLTEEELETLHNDHLIKCFPGVFYDPSAEEADAVARKFERFKVIKEITAQQEG